MKWLLILSAWTVLATAEETYSTENDNFDIEALAKDPVQLKAFLNCFIDKGPCDAVAADFKKDIPEAFAQGCAKCTAAQKFIFKVALEAIKTKEPQGYSALLQKYDPENKYIAGLEAAIANA